jgi:hypothetical protein
MDMVLGISMAPTMVRLVLIEGQNADGVTVEEDHFAVAAGPQADRVVDAIVASREGATQGGHRLTATGLTWMDSADVGALRDAIASRDAGSVMLVSPLLAAAALTRAVGDALDQKHIAMLYVERDSATLAVVEVADGSIVDVRRQPLAGDAAAELAVLVAGLAACGSQVDAVSVVGCGVGCGADALAIKAALEAVAGLRVIVPEEPDMALARGAALASANAPLFASSTAALEDFAADDAVSIRRRRPLVLAGSALAAVAAGLVVVSLTSDGRAPSAPQPTTRAVAPTTPSAAQPAPEAAAAPAPPPMVLQTPPTAISMVPPAPPPRPAPTRRAPQSVPTPVQQPRTPPPPAAPPEPVAVPAPPPPPGQYQRPPRTFYIRLPFVPVLIPINPPPRPAPPPLAPPPPAP